MGDRLAEIYRRLFNFWLFVLAVIAALKLWGTAQSFTSPPELQQASAPVPSPASAVTLPGRDRQVEEVGDDENSPVLAGNTASGPEEPKVQREAPETATAESTVAEADREPLETVEQLNRLTREEFQQVSGIGPVISERIVDRREQMDGFSSVADLREVNGIGESRSQDILDWLYRNAEQN